MLLIPEHNRKLVFVPPNCFVVLSSVIGPSRCINQSSQLSLKRCVQGHVGAPELACGRRPIKRRALSLKIHALLQMINSDKHSGPRRRHRRPAVHAPTQTRAPPPSSHTFILCGTFLSWSPANTVGGGKCSVLFLARGRCPPPPPHTHTHTSITVAKERDVPFMQLSITQTVVTGVF